MNSYVGEYSKKIESILRQERERNKLDVWRASDLVEVPVERLLRYETGEASPPMRILSKMLISYGASEDTLFQIISGISSSESSSLQP